MLKIYNYFDQGEITDLRKKRPGRHNLIGVSQLASETEAESEGGDLWRPDSKSTSARPITRN